MHDWSDPEDGRPSSPQPATDTHCHSTFSSSAPPTASKGFRTFRDSVSIQESRLESVAHDVRPVLRENFCQSCQYMGHGFTEESRQSATPSIRHGFHRPASLSISGMTLKRTPPASMHMLMHVVSARCRSGNGPDKVCVVECCTSALLPCNIGARATSCPFLRAEIQICVVQSVAAACGGLCRKFLPLLVRFESSQAPHATNFGRWNFPWDVRG